MYVYVYYIYIYMHVCMYACKGRQKSTYPQRLRGRSNTGPPSVPERRATKRVYKGLESGKWWTLIALSVSLYKHTSIHVYTYIYIYKYLLLSMHIYIYSKKTQGLLLNGICSCSGPTSCSTPASLRHGRGWGLAGGAWVPSLHLENDSSRLGPSQLHASISILK